MNYAMIVTTSAMLNTLGIQTNTEILKQMCVLLHGDITEEAHPGKNLVCRIFNYISCSYKKLDGIKWTLDRKKKPIKVEILESTFEQILEQIGAADKKTAVRVLLDEAVRLYQRPSRYIEKLCSAAGRYSSVPLSSTTNDSLSFSRSSAGVRPFRSFTTRL